MNTDPIIARYLYRSMWRALHRLPRITFPTLLKQALQTTFRNPSHLDPILSPQSYHPLHLASGFDKLMYYALKPQASKERACLRTCAIFYRTFLESQRISSSKKYKLQLQRNLALQQSMDQFTRYLVPLLSSIETHFDIPETKPEQQ